MSEQLTLEQSEARRMEAEREAEALRASLDRERGEGATRKALGESLGNTGEIAALKRELAAVRQTAEEARTLVETGFGENGVEMHNGVAHGSGQGGGQQDELPTLHVYAAVAGDPTVVTLYGRVGG